MTANATDLDIEYLEENSDQPEVPVNAMSDALAAKIIGDVILVMDSSHVLNLTKAEQAQGSIFVLTSASPAAVLPSTVNVYPVGIGVFSFENQTDVVVTVQVNGQAMTAPTVNPGSIAILNCDGVNVKVASGGSSSGGITKLITASEGLAAGDMVNVWNDSGTAKIRKANATDATKPAHGFVLAAVTSGLSGIFIGAGSINNKRSALTPGTAYYLDTAGGGITAVAPSSSGNLIQELGVALSATELAFAPKTTLVA